MNHGPDLNHLLDDFVVRVPHTRHILAVSAEGMLVARDSSLAVDQAERLSAIASGLVSLLAGAARSLRADPVVSNLTQIQDGFMFSMSVQGGASLLVVADRSCDIGQVGHELAALVNRVGPALSPRARSNPSPTTG